MQSLNLNWISILNKGKKTVPGVLPAMVKGRCTAEEKILVPKLPTTRPICHLFRCASQTAYLGETVVRNTWGKDRKMRAKTKKQRRTNCQ
jgi:hypothetical protein